MLPVDPEEDCGRGESGALVVLQLDVSVARPHQGEGDDVGAQVRVSSPHHHSSALHLTVRPVHSRSQINDSTDASFLMP